MNRRFALGPSCFPYLTALLAAHSIACGGDVIMSPSTGGSGGSGGSGGASASTGVTGEPACEPSQVGLQGTIDGIAVQGVHARRNSRIKGPLAEFFFGDRGQMALFAESSLEEPLASAEATGLLRMPGGDPRGGEWFCAGGGSRVSLGAPRTFALASLARLGPCPGAPVEGEVVGCFGGQLGFCPAGPSLRSTLRGAEFDWTSAVTGTGGMPGLYEIFLDNGGLLTLDIDLDTVLGGLLFIAPGSPDEGALYCFSGGFLEPGGQGAIKFTLGGLSRLGTCADAKPVDGAIAGCAP
jgi:hypothetical protein